ncbi:MAG TPA: solute carrier family 23 protein [bacterium]|nr:solute carrier family 23 protein [bacterium]HPN29702.1 solute carrier family 23 protein [bacterium]
MAKKPSNLIFGVDDKIPFFTLVLLGLQHTFIFFISLIFPLIIIKELGGSITQEIGRSYISMSLIAGGVVTILQARKGIVGSGYLCPGLSGPSYFDSSKQAAALGGLPLVFGMTMLAGVIETIFSRIMHKFKYLFPTEVTGVIVTMVGIVVIPISIKNFFGISESNNILDPVSVKVACLTLTLMAFLSVFGKGKLKLYGPLIGMISGYMLSYFFGVLTKEDIKTVFNTEFFSLPAISHIKWSFDFSLIIPFFVATLCSTFKTIGDLVTCQKINDSEWKRPDMKSVSGGILADGLGGIIPGIIGGFGQSTSSTNIGLSLGTAATSRRIAFAQGSILILLAFFSQFAQLFLIMPQPVMGATLIFSISFMIVSGLQIITSRMLDSRKIFIVGVSIIFGLSVDAVPEIYQSIHSWIRPIFSSSLSLAAVSALILNILFRFGISKNKSISILSGEDNSEKLSNFMEEQGKHWGARSDVIKNVSAALQEFADASDLIELTQNEINISVSYDEFNIAAAISYKGPKFEAPEKKPNKEELKKDLNASLKLSGYFIKNYADKIWFSENNGYTILNLHFEH